MERPALDADGVLGAPMVVVRRRGVAGETILATCQRSPPTACRCLALDAAA
jgi:hypothetical protein